MALDWKYFNDAAISRLRITPFPFLQSAAKIYEFRLSIYEFHIQYSFIADLGIAVLDLRVATTWNPPIIYISKNNFIELYNTLSRSHI